MGPRHRLPLGLFVLVTSCQQSSHPTETVSFSVSRAVTAEDGSVCYQICPESDPPTTDFGDECASAIATECSLRSQQDSLRVAIDYGVAIAEGEDPPAPKLATLVGSTLEELSPTFRFEERGEGSDTVPIAITEIRTPASGRSKSLVLRATVPEGVVDDAGPFQVAAPDAQVWVDTCDEASCASCTRPASLGRTRVWVVGPIGLLGSEVLVASRVNGVMRQELASKVVLSVQEADRARGAAEVATPGSVGDTWSLWAEIAGREYDPPRCDVALVAARPPRLAIDAADEDVNASMDPLPEPPSRVFAEPESQCRTYAVSVQAVDSADGSVTLRTSLGTFDGAGAQVDVALDDTSLASAQLSLPADHSQRELTITAVAGSGLETRRTITLDPVSPLEATGTLKAPRSEVQVGASGSPGDFGFLGRVYAPRGARFAPDTTLRIETEATTAPTTETLRCGTSLDASLVACRPNDPNPATRGGCLLTPAAVSLGENGTFTVPLRSGVCFAGEVTVRAYAVVTRAGQDAEPCLGAREVSSDEVLVATSRVHLIGP